MAYDPVNDADRRHQRHLFPTCTTWIGFRRDRFLRDYMVAFLELLVPETDRRRISEAIAQTERGAAEEAAEARPLNGHPAIESRFSNCCGDFNL
jgi:hypothetical protein